MVDNSIIKQMLEKADAGVFYFGGSDESYYWRVAEIDEEIFAERAQIVGSCRDVGCYNCAKDAKEARLNIYYDMVADFASYYCDYWRNDIPSDVFEAIASPSDEGLLSVLGAFHKKYSDFLNDVMYRFSYLVETVPKGGFYETVRLNYPCEDVRLIRAVLKRLAVSCPIIINTEDNEYFWQLAYANGEIWYRRVMCYYRDYSTYMTEEYGHISRSNADAFGALQDAVRSCFLIDGWHIIGGASDDVEAMLGVVELSSDELFA